MQYPYPRDHWYRRAILSRCLKKDVDQRVESSDDLLVTFVCRFGQEARPKLICGVAIRGYPVEATESGGLKG